MRKFVRSASLSIAFGMLIAATGGSRAANYNPPMQELRPGLSPAVMQHVDMAYLLWHGTVAKNFLTQLLWGTIIECRVCGHDHSPFAGSPIAKELAHPYVVPPVRVFDQLVYLGNNEVGSWALKTSAGIIIFDTLENSRMAKDIIVGGLRKIGWDPAQIKYVVVTHGHFDHYGGARYLQKTFHPHVLASPADWIMMEHPPKRLPPGMSAWPAPPHHDMDVTDGERLTLGHTTVRLYITPGHTPETVSALIPVTWHGHPHMLSFYGGTGAPASIGPTRYAGGLLEYQKSLMRFTKLGIDAGVDGIISNHPVSDDTPQKVAILMRRGRNGPNPWIVGKATYISYMGAWIEAVEAITAYREGQRPQ